MNNRNLLNDNVIEVPLSRGAGTTGTTLVSDVIDMLGYDRLTGILLISSTQAASGVLAFNHQHSSLSTAGFEATTAALTGLNGPGMAAVIEVVDPLKRYHKFTVNPTGNGSSPIGGITTIKGSAGHRPVAQSTASVVDSVTVINPST